MKAFVDQDMCIGCGICTQIAPGFFEMDVAVAVASGDDIDVSSQEKVEDAFEKCPVNAISIS